MLNRTRILLTGGTGSFGYAFVRMTLDKFDPEQIIIYSRDEMKQWEMANKFNHNPKLKFIIGDIRDYQNLYKAVNESDYVVHAAATKIVPLAETNPAECIKTNVIGAMNLIDASVNSKVRKVVSLSTDKASNPVNLYGASKLASDKLFVAGNTKFTKFSVVRYGNVIGSRGSVIPLFMSLKDSGVLPITDKRMTRFMITLEESIELVWHVLNDMNGGEIYTKKIPSMLVTDIAKAINPKAEHKIIGIRPGEKIHEQMISIDDAPFTYEYKDYYKIIPATYTLDEKNQSIKDGKLVDTSFIYSSDNNHDWMSVDDLKIKIKIEL
jgi:UDP-N-acetylglucosamine 4,6-dehydratase (inverting)